ncbi:MAG: hypothetical protein ACFFB2_13225 [Promethearchaeota archaeon]
MDEFPKDGTVFVADDEIYPNINLFFEQAEKEVIILSPWIELTVHVEDTIKAV